MVSERVKQLRESMGLSQAKLAKELGVSRASVNAWEMEISLPTAPYLVEMAHLFHTTTDYILGLDSQEQISLRGMSQEEIQLVYSLVDYITYRREHSQPETVEQ